MMHGPEKSDPAIVAAKPANKAGQLAAEWVERRAGPRGRRFRTTRAGRRTGKACHRGWTAYGKRQGKGGRSGSPRFTTISAHPCCGLRSLLSSGTRHLVWMG